MTVLRVSATIAITAIFLFRQLSGCSAQAGPGRHGQEPVVQLRLTEVLRIGSSEGPEALGRIMSGAFDSSGRIFVADDANHRVSVFAPDGTLLRHIGEGEFQQPWHLAIDRTDSVFVWDQGRSLVSVFSPTLELRRSFPLPPEWVPRSFRFLGSGDLLLAVSNTAAAPAVHVVDRTGRRFRRHPGEASPVGSSSGSERPSLGGVLDVDGDEVAYAGRPSEITFYTLGDDAHETCRTDGSRSADVTNGSGAAELDPFVHSVGITALGSHVYLHQVRDPIRNIRVMELVRSDCTRLRRTELGLPLGFLARRGDLLLASRTLDFAELVVYRFELVNRSDPSRH